MIDYELVKKAEKKCGSCWCVGANEELISNLGQRLNVTFPKSYVEFLKVYGEGGIPGMYIYGIDDETFSSAYKYTMKYRNEKNINPYWVVIGKIKTDEENFLICLDTANFVESECTLIKYDLIDDRASDLECDFSDYFNYRVKKLLEK